jgi:CRISPR/Cas system CSM-associated protein Csm4 (group 5 of RAMP superfamily)
MISKKIIVLISILMLIILFVILFSTYTIKPADLTLEELKNIAKQNSQVNTLLQDKSVQINYRKLTAGQIQNLIDSGQISSDVSSEIYMVDFISSQTNSGVTLIIDLENKNILKSQTVVGVSVG